MNSTDFNNKRMLDKIQSGEIKWTGSRNITNSAPTKKYQQVMSSPTKILVGEKVTKSGTIKNRYSRDRSSKLVKTITHEV